MFTIIVFCPTRSKTVSVLGMKVFTSLMIYDKILPGLQVIELKVITEIVLLTLLFLRQCCA